MGPQNRRECRYVIHYSNKNTLFSGEYWNQTKCYWRPPTPTNRRLNLVEWFHAIYEACYIFTIKKFMFIGLPLKKNMFNYIPLLDNFRYLLFQHQHYDQLEHNNLLALTFIVRIWVKNKKWEKKGSPWIPFQILVPIPYKKTDIFTNCHSIK